MASDRLEFPSACLGASDQSTNDRILANSLVGPWPWPQFASFFWGPAHPAAAIEYQITDIRISGNEKTRREILLRELGFSAGMTVSAAEIEKGRKSIMALGLFTTVETRLQPTKTGHRLWVHVREKYFFLPVPIVHLSGDGDWTYGVMSKTDNLLGLNQQLKVMFRHKVYHDADIKREDRLQIRYQTPRIANSLFGLEFGFYRERALLDEVRQRRAGSYERRLTGGSITMSRWLRAGRAESWLAHVGWVTTAGVRAHAVVGRRRPLI